MKGWLGDDRGCTADYIIRILEACGEAVQMGYMEPFVLRCNDLEEVRTKISNSKDLQKLERSFQEFRKIISQINLLEEEE